ncbi:hypothetical protein MKW98_015038 [Papaver atlanticum]|uniref:Uncharacterized protein n=1 Tax=Papaver atlanticum TaxID=357466 RepID=A0AAD4S739_9MAGN|nr:hypothetical protein MKW98_015038 [Papaver atlanticum]
MEATNESERVTELETRLLNLQEENATLRGQVSCGETSREMDGRVDVAQLKSQVTVSSNHEIEFGKELEAYKIKCQSLSVELERKGMELENLQAVNTGLDHEREDYRTKCIGLEEQLVEDGNVMSQREKSAGERISHLEEVVKKMQTDEKERFRELETLQEENATLRALQNGVSGEITCREMDAMVDVADEAQLIRTETCQNSTFTPSCECSSLQINSNGVLSSGDAPPGNYQTDYYFARAVLGGFETEGICSGTPSSENQVLLKQDGARPSTTCIVEIFDISDNEGET